MGNSAAVQLAVIFMHHIESQILRQSDNILYWRRYIDDIFVISTCDLSTIIHLANSIHPKIQFTHECPVNNSIPFLDSLVHFNNTSFDFELYIKPTHSGTCLTFDSYTPFSRKRNLIFAETLRAKNIASNHYYKISSIDKIKNKLALNDYPKDIVCQYSHGNSHIPTEKLNPTNFIKVPFISSSQKKQIIQSLNNTKLNRYIRVIFTNSRPLAWQFRPKKSFNLCLKNCLSCKTAFKPDLCYTKNIVYKIECSICKKLYFGQSSRCINSRIVEHISCNKSNVFIHMSNHGFACNLSFTWSIIHSNVVDYNKRLALESMYIDRNCSNLINGCQSSQIIGAIRTIAQ